MDYVELLNCNDLHCLFSKCSYKFIELAKSNLWRNNTNNEKCRIKKANFMLMIHPVLLFFPFDIIYPILDELRKDVRNVKDVWNVWDVHVRDDILVHLDSYIVFRIQGKNTYRV